MPVNLPTEISVECDSCGEEKEFNATEYGGDPPTVGLDETTLTEEGWTREGSEVFCPECKEEGDRE